MLTFYLFTTPISLYMAYLLAFKMYQKEEYESEREWRRPADMPITYILVFLFALLPILNICGTLAIVGIVIFCEKNYKIDSWLFRKPKQPDEEKEK